MSESVYSLRDALSGAGYRVGEITEGRSFLAESRERAVWGTVFETPQELLDCWLATQAEAIELTQALAPEKSWELYLLLASELEAGEEAEADLDAVRRDTSYARKVLALGVETLTVAEIDDYLAPLKALEPFTEREGPDALAQLDQLVAAEGSADEIAVLEAFKANRPLFGEL